MLQRKNVHPRAILAFGLAALALANVSGYLLRRNGTESDLTDTVQGFAFGIAIGTILLGLYLARRRQAGK